MPGVSKAIYTNTNTKYKNNKTNVVLHFEFELGSPLYEILAQYGFNHNLENQSISRQLSCDPSLIPRVAF